MLFVVLFFCVPGAGRAYFKGDRRVDPGTLILRSSPPQNQRFFLTNVSRLVDTRKDATIKLSPYYAFLFAEGYREMTSGRQGAAYLRRYAGGWCIKTVDFVKEKLGRGYRRRTTLSSSCTWKKKKKKIKACDDRGRTFKIYIYIYFHYSTGNPFWGKKYLKLVQGEILGL